MNSKLVALLLTKLRHITGSFDTWLYLGTSQHCACTESCARVRLAGVSYTRSFPADAK